MAKPELTQAQIIDPGISLAMELSQRNAPEFQGSENVFNYRKVLAGATLAAGFITLGTGYGDAKIVEAGETVCVASDFATGECVEWYTYPDSPATTQPKPQPTNPPATNPPATNPPSNGGSGNSGGNNNSGNNNSGNGNSRPVVTSPPKPTFEQILNYVGCEDDKGNPTLATELEVLKGADGSRRLVTLIDWCELDFIEENGIMPEYGRPNTNWEDAIRNPDLSITPNGAQLNAVNVYLSDEWLRLNPPATTTTVETTTTTLPATTTTAETTTTTLPATTTTAETITTEAEPVVEIAETIDTTAETASSTTELAAVAVSDSNGDSGSGTNWLLPIGLTGAGLAGGFSIFALARRRRHEDDGQGDGNPVPVASA